MSKLLLSIHVLGAILFIGPLTVATSLFPRSARIALEGGHSPGAEPVPRLLHRISRTYAVLGLAVPAFGLATGARLGVLGDAWLVASVALTVLAAGLLALVVLPGQQALIEVPGPTAAAGVATRPAVRRALVRLTMATGAFGTLWAVVVVLMIVRPGSTTGV